MNTATAAAAAYDTGLGHGPTWRCDNCNAGMAHLQTEYYRDWEFRACGATCARSLYGAAMREMRRVRP